MTVSINDLNDAWVAAGQKVSDLQNKAQAMVMADATAEDIQAIQTEIVNAKAKRDLAHDNLVDARADEILNMETVEPLSDSEKDLKTKFVNEFKGMMKGDPKVVNSINSSTDESGNKIGLTIPVDVKTAINELKRQYDSLEQYVNKESVSTASGSRVYEKWSDVTPLADLDAEDAEIKEQDAPKLSLIKYTIKRYAGINTITNSLLNDTAENILAWLSTWIARKTVVTRNVKIIAAMNTVPKKPTLTKFDDIKELALNTVDPAIQATSMFMTNTSGFAALAKVKDAQGRYLIQPNVTNPEIKMIEGKVVTVIADKWLPNVNGLMPLYFGDLKQAVTLFDRENMSLLSTNIGGGAFETDTTKIRVIDRFDVTATDTEAWVAGSFKAIADQQATTPASN
ncbi:prophage protein, major head protein [Weissella oryzae SG25]|uniref:Prophage protein, major head protein n=1 Tax=Weissella oryzae (strain DSM 25784 / JCM 18191 / LMG 30913 / SG25) TaxID=1329250 RepID=A0A069CXN8_WEIOS|nr:phage major capsid protein [Weissella oryzae]GAK32018.1 prophage protein, major head protein [Weissella oryzae SG25]